MKDSVNIAVCFKHVIDETELGVNEASGQLILGGVPTKVSDFDKNAIEEAIRLKEKYGGKVVGFTMGPREAKKSIREVYSMGIDVAYLLTDSAFEGSDTLGTARILAAGIRKLEHVDLILCAEGTSDVYCCQVGPQIAEILGIPQLTYVGRIESVSDGRITVERTLDDGVERVESSLPCVVTVTSEINTPRYASIVRIRAAAKKTIVELNSAALGLSSENVGENSSKVHVHGYDVVTMTRKRIVLDGPPNEVALKLVRALAEEGVLR